MGASFGGTTRPAPAGMTSGFGMGGAGRSAGMFPQGGGGGAGGMSSFGRLGAAQQMRPQGTMGSSAAGMLRPAAPAGQTPASSMGSMGFMRPAAPAAAPSGQAAGAARGFGNIGSFALSDERSKQKIADLESVKQRYEDLLDGPTAETPELRDPRSSLDDAFRRPGSYSYEYKDPTMAGAAPGRHVGPMAHELRGIPGAVETGPDGYERVSLPRTTLATVSQVAKQRRELDELRAQMDALGDSGALSPAEGDAVSRTFGGR
jgi:hypothetical protein